MIGKTIKRVYRTERWGGEDRIFEDDSIFPSNGDPITLEFTDGSSVVLDCCSCCEGLDIETVREPE